MTVRKFNYFRFGVFIAIVIAIIVGIVLLISHINYTKTNQYKLLNIGYTEEEISILNNKLNESEINKLMKLDYNSVYVNLIKEKYFMFKNFDKYLSYRREHTDYDYSKIISIINTEANIDWIDEEKDTDTSKGILMLVNRLYGLNKEYEVGDIVDVPVKYAYNGKKLSNILLDDLKNMCDEASQSGYTLVVSDGYRSYDEQEKLYNSYVSSNGRSEADKVVARPGHSEYETGLSLDLVPYNKNYDTPKASEEYIWLRENAHRYGFIFRFDQEKENLTGFKEYTWRLRYVGEDAATIIYNENICFEEYYAFYVEGEKNE